MAWRGSAGPLILLVVALGLAGTATAEEDPNVQILDDVGEDGTTHAGAVNALGWVLTNENGEPAAHQDAVFEVAFEGTTLLKTSAASGHDYDGIDPYYVQFPGPGNYSVTVTTWEAGEERTATATGQVLPAPEGELSIEAEVPESVTAGEPASFAYEVLGPNGTPAEHADVQVHVRRAEDAFEIFNARTHTHDGAHSFNYTFDRAGTFEVVLVATPVAGEGQPAGQATSQRFTIEVAEPSAPRTSKPSGHTPHDNGLETGSEEGRYQLFGTYDPWTTVSPHQRLRLGGVVFDTQTGALARNVSYEATLKGPDGRTLFASTSLHSVDGVLEVSTSRPQLGDYTLHLTATRGDWSDSLELNFGVIPPAVATDAGPLVAHLNTTETPEAGSPFTLPLKVTGAANAAPATHGEVDWRVLDTEGVPVYGGKLHSHYNGTFPLTLAFPSSGTHTLETLPMSTEPAPTPSTYGGELGQPPVFDVDVDQGPSLADDPPLEAASNEDPDRDEQAALPAPGLATLLLALAGLAEVRRRSGLS